MKRIFHYNWCLEYMRNEIDDMKNQLIKLKNKSDKNKDDES